MRVRRASTHARRPSVPLIALVAVSAIAVLAATPDALGAHSRTAASADRVGDRVSDGAAHKTTAGSLSSGIRVVNRPIPAATAQESRRMAVSSKSSAASGPLLAHLRRPSVSAFSMLGVTWEHLGADNPVTVEIRTKSAGTWSEWTEIETDPDGGPLTGRLDSSFRDGTEPDWVGSATGLEVAVYGKGTAPASLEVSTIDPGKSPASAMSVSTKGGQVTGRPGSFPTIPRIITRKQWGADESLGDECWDPKYGRTFKAVIVHHTAGTNDYTASESKAIVRGIYAYHTQSRGWCDIGYNFLIDRFGNVFEGRDGGIRRSVRGAHAGDYNVNTTGISLMGNFDLEKPTRAMTQSLVSLIAWRLGTAYLHAFGRPFIFDHRINRISGHRDVMATSCPGQYVYDWLPKLRRRVNERLGTWSSPIERAWQRSGGKKSSLGSVRIGEVGRSGGHRTVFQHGRVYLSEQGLHTLYAGAILHQYVASGEIAGPLGYPRTNARTVGDGPGKAVFFDGGRAYWSKRTGARIVRAGPILQKYIALKGPLGALGFPRTPVLERKTFAVARFQHGSIRYDRSSDTVTVEYT
jgi:uncharacterized protein with LGFP repeats